MKVVVYTMQSRTLWPEHHTHTVEFAGKFVDFAAFQRFARAEESRSPHLDAPICVLKVIDVKDDESPLLPKLARGAP